MVLNLCDGRCACCDKHDLRFAEHSTCHGVKRFCNTWHISRRVFWFVFVMASMGLLLQQLHERTTNFLNFDLKTEILLETVPSLALPSVTICNMNMFSKSLLTEMDYELLQVSENLTDWIKTTKPFVNTTIKYWDKVAEFEQNEREILARYNMTDFTVRSWLRRTGWQLNETGPHALIQCTVGRQLCSLVDFKQTVTPQGVCYTINWNETRYHQRLPGLEAGFNILLDIDQLDYTHYKLDSKSQYECGTKVLLHEPYDETYSGTNLAQFVGVDPGKMAFIAAQKNVQIRENNRPWDECSDNPYLTKRNCLARCTAEDSVNKCQCRLWFESVDNATNCGVARTTACLVYKEAVGNSTADEQCQKKCLHACEETSYSVGVSYTLLTSMLTSVKFSDMLRVLTNDSFNYTTAYIRRNILQLQIAYPDLVIDTAYSTPAFPTSAFISDLGGQLGLFAGISVVTIAELLEYPFLKIYTIFFTKNRKLRKHHRRKSGNNSRDSTVTIDSMTDTKQHHHSNHHHHHHQQPVSHVIVNEHQMHRQQPLTYNQKYQFGKPWHPEKQQNEHPPTSKMKGTFLSAPLALSKWYLSPFYVEQKPTTNGVTLPAVAGGAAHAKSGTTPITPTSGMSFLF